MTVEIVATDPRVVTLEQRMPFHFGNFARSDADISESDGPNLLLELETEIDGETETGLSMGGIAAAWFIKGSDVDLSAGTDALLDVFETSFDLASGLEAETPFDLWLDLYGRVGDWATGTDYPPLLWAYGVSLVEQAIVDAYCRHEGLTVAEAVRSNALGVDLGAIHEELSGASPAELLPDEPLRSTAVRHTVGQTDPLDADDAAESLEDGLPQTLADYVRSQGVDHFKIKLSSDVETDAARLGRIAAVLADCGLEEYAFTLDANEGYESAAAFRGQWEELAADPALDSFLDNLLYVEQPLARNDAFSAETRDVFAGWADGPPIIIDESDDSLESLPRALECGYAGTSHKNCKGVFKGIANRCLIERYRREDPDGEYLMSGEDLTTVGPVELLQDLAVMGSLGMAHVERNGHHYYRGLSSLPAGVQAAVLSEHGDLYRRHENGFATLDIRDGRIDFGSVIDAPFGRAFDLDVAQFPPLAEWRR